MSGAPIYLVSACTSGEEFIAAFRRYADKQGLFIPIGQPLAVGRRSRFAVTLRDGGVMIEGEAEVISSARTASVLHGRIGMTLRFHEPDEASRTTLGELERARLAMRPPPPSIPPRPAELPGEPRPVPPAPQGRIDAVNALAECVAIGDPEPPPVLPPGPPPRAGNKATMPGVPPSSSGSFARPRTPSAPSIGLGAAPRTPTAPLPIVIAKAGDEAPPLVTPRATPQPDVLRNAEQRELPAPDPMAPRHAMEMPVAVPRTPTKPGVAPIPSGPIVPPLISPPPAAAAIAPEAKIPGAKISETMTAVPAPSPLSPSSPTEVGGVIVEPMPLSDPAIPLDTPASDPAIVAPREEPSGPTQVAGGPPQREVRDTVASEPLERRRREDQDDERERAALERRRREDQDDERERAALERRRREDQDDRGERAALDREDHDTEANEPLARPPLFTVDPLPVPEIEICEPTDISLGPPEPLPSESLTSLPPEVVDLHLPDVSELLDAAEPPGDAAPDVTVSRRRTVLGVAPAPRPSRTSGELASDGWEPPDVRLPATPKEGWTIPETALREGTPTDGWTVPPEPPITPSGSTPSMEITAQRDVVAPADTPPEQAPVPGGALPSGDWTIARDPEAPDGWSAPFQTIPPNELDGPPQPVVAGAQLLDSSPRVAAQRLDELPIQEPKVQIDPTLIEPAAVTLTPDEAAAMARSSAPELPRYVVPPVPAVEAPPMNVRMAVPAPSPFAVPHGPPMHPGQAPPYSMDPGYSMMPTPPERRYASDPALPALARRRRLIVVLISALIAVVIGIVVLLVIGDGRDSAPGKRAVERTAPPEPARSGSAAPAPAPSPETPAPPARQPAVAPPPAADCFADVTSTPAGAEIVIEQNKVIGTTPQKVALPCGGPVELVIRKGRLLPATRTVTPTAEGARVKVALAKQTFLIKVNSTPPGATVTLGGRSLGVTPTTVKVPAFELSVLAFSKEGYAIATEKVVPKASGGTVHSVLTRIGTPR